MLTGYDIAYGLGLAAASPLLIHPRLRAKVGEAWREKRGFVEPRPATDRGPCVLIHAVSVGEVGATRELVGRLLAARDDLSVVVTTTTTTGQARARQLFDPVARVRVERFPVDLSPGVGRLLERLRVDVSVLMELEVWPNFMKLCERRGVPVILGNGRITTKSLAGYRRVGPVARRMFGRLTRVLAQDATYAGRFRELGAPRVEVAGTMKFDTATLEPPAGDPPGGPLPTVGGRLWVCGSTGPGEEPVLLEVYRRLRGANLDLRLVVVPRKPERFDEVAALLGPHVWRRSAGGPVGEDDVLLVDAMGELRHWYARADVCFVGRTLVDLGPSQRGSDMIEPAALGVATCVGPWTQNFAGAMSAFGDAVPTVADADALHALLARWLADPDTRPDASGIVRRERGATDRHVAAVLEAIGGE